MKLRHILIIVANRQDNVLNSKVQKFLTDNHIVSVTKNNTPIIQELKEKIDLFDKIFVIGNVSLPEIETEKIVHIYSQEEIPEKIRQISTETIIRIVDRPIQLKEELDKLADLRETIQTENEDLNLKLEDLQDELKFGERDPQDIKDEIVKIKARKDELKILWEQSSSEYRTLLEEKSKLDEHLMELAPVLIEDENIFRLYEKLDINYRNMLGLIYLDKFLGKINKGKDVLRTKIIAEFWKFYSDVAIRFVKNRNILTADEVNDLRLVLRFCVISKNDKLIPVEKVDKAYQHIRSEGELRVTTIKEEETPIFYMDEYFEYLVKVIPPTSREHLPPERRKYELLWKRNRIIDKELINLKNLNVAQIQNDIKRCEKGIDNINAEIARLRMNTRRTPSEDKKLVELMDERKKMIDSKKEITRVYNLYSNKIVEKKENEKNEVLKNIKTLEMAFKVRNEEPGFEEAIDEVIKRECEEIRHWMKICCGRGREESNPVDLIRQVDIRMDSEFLNSRNAIKNQVKKVEEIDNEIFMRPIYLEKVEVGLKRRDASIMMIVPVVGERAYCCQSADAWSSGKVIIPMFWKARGLTIIPALGQFRFQSVKEDAGDEWVITENFAGEFDNWYSTVKKSVRKREELGIKRGLTVFAFMHVYTKFIHCGAQEYWISDKDLREIFKKYIPIHKKSKLSSQQ